MSDVFLTFHLLLQDHCICIYIYIYIYIYVYTYIYTYTYIYVYYKYIYILYIDACFSGCELQFQCSKTSPWDNRADSRGHQRRCPTCSIFQACQWKWWNPCCFNIFKWASSDKKKTLAMIIVVMINQMSYLVFYHLLSFVYGEHQNIWPIVFRFNWTISLNPHRLMSAPFF